ncbi:MAG: tetratricopeptide (TPR) repeat protein [Flavobacteriaceae bacterium]|jgi:tetratricopeptide (TPR) repeat protein
MKKLFLFVCIVALTATINAQVKTPAPSPAQTIEQAVGLTNMTLEYSRPAMREREIFGGLVPYGKLWRTGANANTKITFSDAVEIGGKTLEAGTYAIFTKPNADLWEVYFYSDSNNWGTPQEWDETKVAAKVKAKVYAMPMTINSFTMTFDDLTNDSVILGMLWENVYVGVPMKFNTDKAVSASIDKAMEGPGAGDYYSAAVYYLESGKDINKAKEWINKAIAKRADAFWYYRQKSLIYAKSGDKKGAMTAAEKSMAMAQEAGNTDYVALNKKSIAEWKNMK